ncbi:hypothetical protein LCGC14_1290870 [marine sediment metagenome]|uniref:3-keto-disaccharide hydrolase domain-containing protein n=1 Tax=marine sediment metagenome TaxID=412755 RepID=A0A0F9KSI7_9ZZZZ
MTLPIPFPTDQLIERKTSIGAMRDLWIPGSFDYDVFEDKFWGDTLHTLYPAAKTSSGSVTFAEHNENGYLSIVADSGSGNYAGQGLGLQFTGDRGYLAEFIVQLPSAITDFKFECGMSDSDAHAGAINQKAATSTFTATDCAVIVMDTTDDANFAFISAMTGTGVETQDITAHLPILSTTYRIAIRAETDSVSAYINGTQVGGGAHLCNGATKMTPWVFCQARTSSERILLLYKWRVIQPAY